MSAPSPTPPSPSALTEEAASFFRDLQDRIVQALADLEGPGGPGFRSDEWQRPGGGGGRSRVLAEGRIFEKAGVNFSDVHGVLRPEMAGNLPGSGTAFRAVGVSLVLHPRNPHVPTVHANFRRLERGNAAWFGGGWNLTPYYLVPDDARHFHRTLQQACAGHDPALYQRFKGWCDRYFFIPHRGEPRGVGGLFFDYLGAGAEATAGEPAPAVASPVESSPQQTFAFVKDVANAFLPAYLPIVERRRDVPSSAEQRRWQLIRRGRYVEFNLVYDRGTIFGLRTDGRIESILMSLPTEARWEYMHEPLPGSPEAETLAHIKAGRDWAKD